MAKAFKCDRCGKFYDKYELNQAFQFKGAPISVCHMLKNGSNSNVMDMCAGCREQLVMFMKGAWVTHVDLAQKEDNIHE